MARVSVIIPTHNRPQLLARALHSVATQTYQDLELIVVQNGGIRGSESAMVDRLRDQVDVTYLYEGRPGVCHARNLGIQHAKGRYIAFLDDDDEWLPTKLERQVEVLERDPGVGVVTCQSRIVDEAGQAIGYGGEIEGELSFQQLVERGCQIPSCSSVIIRRECLDRVGYFSTRYRIVDDYDLYLRLAIICRFVALPEPLFYYRLHSGNISKQEDRMWKEYVEVLQTVRPSSHHGLTRQSINAARFKIQKHHYSLATQAMQGGHYQKASRIFWDALRLDPLIGLKLPWGRSRNPIYRTIRPYVGGVYCGVVALCQHPT